VLGVPPVRSSIGWLAMMKCDAVWLSGTLAKFSVAELSPVLNLGSSTLAFRTTEQPYIQELIVAPMEARGVRMVHTDLKHAPGVDIAGDIFDDADFARLKAVGVRSVICTHMFEHVVDRAERQRRILDLCPENGLYFVTVPSSYPEHNDPIDTLFRPTPEGLAAVFGGGAANPRDGRAGRSQLLDAGAPPPADRYHAPCNTLLYSVR
jgi:hypothetical protein